MWRFWLFALPIALPSCALNDFVERQQQWNSQIGMGSMNTVPFAGERPRNDDDAQTQARIKFGEDLENQEARQAAAPQEPSPASNCTTTSSGSSGPNAGRLVSSTVCH